MRDGCNMTRCVMLALALIGTAACDQASEMYHQPRADAMEASDYFADGTSARHPVAGTVSVGTIDQVRQWRAGVPVATPGPDAALRRLHRGQERYAIWCSPCHGSAGYGDGMIVQRGYPAAPSFHDDRLRHAPDAHFEQVIAHGLGKMPAYGAHVPQADRALIIDYIRALQLSQNASLDDQPPAVRERLLNPAPAQEGGGP